MSTRLPVLSTLPEQQGERLTCLLPDESLVQLHGAVHVCTAALGNLLLLCVLVACQLFPSFSCHETLITHPVQL